MLCEGALSCIEQSDRWGADFFLRDVMGFSSKDPEALLILWQELKKRKLAQRKGPLGIFKNIAF